MGGRIDCYLDIASFYSYIAFVQILKNKPLFDQHSVEIDIHPVLLGAINAGSGNKPPWTLPAKAAYGDRDFERAKRAAGLPELSAPPGDLMVLSRVQVALRALQHLKARGPAATYLAAFHYLFHAFWAEHQDLRSAEAVGRALAQIPTGFAGPGTGDAARPLLTPEQVEEALRAAAAPEGKAALKRSTDEALARGAFGCPWLWVTRADGDGEGEPFFGSDRWHHIYEFLGLPYQDVALLPPSGAKDKAKL